MSVRVHVSDTNLNVAVAINREELERLHLDFPDEVITPALVIDDGGNCEAWLIVGSFHQLREFAMRIMEQVDPSAALRARGRG